MQSSRLTIPGAGDDVGSVRLLRALLAATAPAPSRLRRSRTSAPAFPGCAARPPPRAFPAPGLRRGHPGRRARSEDPRADGQPAGVQDADLGLPRRPRRRGAGPGRPAAMRQWGQALAAAEARYGVDRHVDRRRLGRRIEFRQGYRRPSPGAVARDPRLLRPAPARLFHRRADGDPEDHRGRRHRRLAPARLVGRRLRPYPVHALDLPAPRGRRRRRRPARHRRFRPRRGRLDRELPEARPAGSTGCPGATRCGCRRASARTARPQERSVPSRPGPPWA